MRSKMKTSRSKDKKVEQTSRTFVRLTSCRASVKRESLEKRIPGKKTDWHVKLKEMMETCSEVQDPEDASRHGQFENLLDNFFTSSRPARNKDELIKGNSFTENGRIYFRSEDLFNYLNVHRFTNTPHEIWTWLRQTDAQTSIIKIKGKAIRVWSLPEPSRYDGSEIALPSQLETEL